MAERRRREWFSWRKARKALASDALSETNVHLKAIDYSEDDNTRDRDLVDLVMRICELALSTGASVSDTTSFAIRIFDAYRLPAHIDITNQSVIVSRPGGIRSDAITAMRHVKHQATDYQRLAELQELVDDLAVKKIDLKEARSRFDDLAVAPRFYRTWVRLAAATIQGMSVALMMGGRFTDVFLSGLAITLIFLVQRQLAKQYVPVFFTQAIGGAIPATIALLMVLLLPHEVPWSPSLVVAAGIVVMLAGLNFVNASQDALDGYYITSSAKTLEVVLLTSGIIAGVMTTLWIGERLGTPAVIWPTGGFGVSPVQQIICGGLLGTAFLVTSYGPGRMLALTFIFGCTAQAVNIGAGFFIEYVPVQRCLAALVVGFCAHIFGKRAKMPIGGLISASVMSLMPGSLIYRGLYGLIWSQSEPTMGYGSGALLMEAVMVGVLLAIGASLGRMLARPFSLPKERHQRRSLLKVYQSSSRY